MKNQIKKEKDLFKKDLSTIDGSYTKCLNDNITLINDLGNDVRIDVNTYKQKILEIVSPAHETNAKRKFVMTLQSKRNKFDAMLYVNNCWLKGSGLEAI